jgi:hypothetical protein
MKILGLNSPENREGIKPDKITKSIVWPKPRVDVIVILRKKMGVKSIGIFRK